MLNPLQNLQAEVCPVSFIKTSAEVNFSWTISYMTFRGSIICDGTKRCQGKLLLPGEGPATSIAEAGSLSSQSITGLGVRSEVEEPPLVDEGVGTGHRTETDPTEALR